MEDTDRWCDKVTLLQEYYESRKRERINEDGLTYTYADACSRMMTYDDV